MKNVDSLMEARHIETPKPAIRRCNSDFVNPSANLLHHLEACRFLPTLESMYFIAHLTDCRSGESLQSTQRASEKDRRLLYSSLPLHCIKYYTLQSS